MKKTTPLLSKAEAAARAGISEKTLDREVKRGRLKPAGHEVPKTGGKLAPLFAPADVDALSSSRAAQQVLPSLLPGRTDGQTTALSHRSAAPPALLRLLAEATAAAVPLRDKHTLSLREAGQLSGVPVSILRAAHKAGQLPAAKIGRGLRVWQADLAAFVETLRPKPKAKRSR